LQVKDSKIPFYDKLPKENQFYKHYMQFMAHNRMKEIALAKVENDRRMFEEASHTVSLLRDQSTR
jgi:hypothetical protein